ncbi:hypothetical protein N1851_026812 [Merluccius polli]|uniref:Uncharacterized protein n=1 Tax=Merluccius polli TaxID=89951 RepID=A0AA47MBB7_MERPO|nr:hypothetical protein N1851_026812 [Merluccius polli]
MDQRGQRHLRRGRGHGRWARGRGVGMRGGGAAARGENRAQVSNEIRATIIDHIMNHSLSFREAGQRVHPILIQSTVASIVKLLGMTIESTNYHTLVAEETLSAEQEAAIIDIVMETISGSIEKYQQCEFGRVLTQHHVEIKQLYRAPFQRNSISRRRQDSSMCSFKLKGHITFIYVAEATFKLSKVRRHGRKTIGQKATVNSAGSEERQYHCAAISNNGRLCHIQLLAYTIQNASSHFLIH